MIQAGCGPFHNSVSVHLFAMSDINQCELGLLELSFFRRGVFKFDIVLGRNLQLPEFSN